MRSHPPDLSAPGREVDSCGIGFIADIQGRQQQRIIAMALEALSNLAHRGAVGADGRSGDGVGILTQIPESFFARILTDLGQDSRAARGLAVGVCFWQPGSAGERQAAIEREIALGELEVLAWRQVPTDDLVLGERARQQRPEIWQVLIRQPGELADNDFERRLYLVRRRIERQARSAGMDDLRVVSLSHRTLVYKSMCLASDLAAFYPDLAQPDFTSSLALFHQRFSTNTRPSWPLAQPFRLLAHNGEINTIQGNANWLAARERELTSSIWGDQVRELLPILDDRGSDSAMLDNVLELLVMFGRDPLHAMMMMIPEATPAHSGAEQRGAEQGSEDPRLRACYDYHATLMEPWDGPAAVVFSDGRYAAAILDRNGLRPQRYWITQDDLVILGSETGLVDLPEDSIRQKGRLGPGEILAVDTLGRELLDNDRIKHDFARRQPYHEWVERYLVEAPAPSSEALPPESDDADLLRRQRTFGYSREAFERILEPMMLEGHQPVGSMGNDTPPAVLAHTPQLLYSYFKQRFAQVTNPAIDSLRERSAFSLETMAGPWGSILGERPEAAHLVRLPSPILDTQQFEWLLALDDSRLSSATVEALFEANPEAASPGESLRHGVDQLCRRVEAAADDGASLIVLSDRGSDAERAPIPMLLATAAAHHHLIRRRKRMQVSLICDTGEPREDHHFACLIGFGATLIHPYLVLRSLVHHARSRQLSAAGAIANYRHALEEGLLKIMAKLGVGPVASYQGAQLFEAMGLDGDLVDRCFTGTTSRIGGVGWERVAYNSLAFHQEAHDTPEDRLPERGLFRFRKDGEYHTLNPRVFKSLHKAARQPGQETFRDFAANSDDGPPSNLRDLLDWQRAERPLLLAEVETASAIVRRFSTAAMSLGALSREAHEALSIAMNRIGGRSNSGEGGEDPQRFEPYTEDRRPEFLGKWQPEAGDHGWSAIKQIASGRFGVNAHYLVSAQELEIKMAQGSKPGEGGQIPGRKVTEEIAKLRRSVPGVTLISPPPHHDIYSIEDLAQLIYDLERVNPRARIGVKLVAGAGVGTIAAGVAKSYADIIQISGDSGGTGSSPLSSIKHAGMPWELGLAETQRALVQAELRDRVTLRVDGGLKTGRDVVLAALLGADEFGFGTMPLIAMGCVMARQCHLDTCPVGIATQRPELRRRFKGTPDHVVHYLVGVAEQVRGILAEIGVRRLSDLIGRVELLRRRQRSDPRCDRIDLSQLLTDPIPSGFGARKRRWQRNARPAPKPPLDEELWRDVRHAVIDLSATDRRSATSEPPRRTYSIRNRDRSVGARLSGEIARRTQGRGLPPGSLRLDLRGIAGQSFGAFLVRGVHLRLIGEAQDYVGKSMSGGEIAVLPPASLAASHDQVIAGNTVLYGATGGHCFLAGQVGERFAVRNSGAVAVVEGCGDHGCEYMT
ncbi:MAG: glutamate synthase large subunit, partial [Acidobacteriota bacterium]